MLRMSEAEAAAARRPAGGPRRGPDDDPQHGPGPPEHARRAAADARDAGRDGAAVQADHRLPAHRHGEDGRAADVPAGRHERHADGLPQPVLQRAGVLARHREAARHRRGHPRAGGVDPHAAVRAQPDVEPPAVPGHQRHGPRRGVDDDLRLARARGGAALLPEGHRPADEPQLRPRRWRRRRPAAGLARRRAAAARADPAAARRVRHADDRPADLAGAPAGRRGDHADRGDRPRRHRAGAALDGCRLGHPARHAVHEVPGGRVRRHRRHLRRRLRPLRHPPQRGPRVDAHRAPDPRPDAGRRLPDPGQEGDAAAAGPHRRVDGGADPPLQDLHRGLQGARGRGLRGGREPAWRARLLHRQRRRAAPVPHAHAGAVVRQHPVPAAHDARPPRRRRRGDHLLRRPRPRRRRPLDMPRLERRQRLDRQGDHRALPAAEVGADPAAAPRPGAGRPPHQRRDGPHRRAHRAHAGRGPRHGDVLRDVQVRAGGQVRRQHLPDDVVHAARRRRADAPRRGAPRHPRRRHHRRRPDHARARRVPGRLHRGAVPAGQLPLPLPGHQRRHRPALRRPPLGCARRRDPAPRHARDGAPADPRRPWRRAAPARGRHRAAAVDPAARTGREPRHDAPARRSRARRASSPATTGRRSSRRASSTTTATRSTATSRPAATRASRRRSPRRRRPSTTRSATPPSSAAAAPASRPA